MSKYIVSMPQLGESVSEGIVARWLVAPGDVLTELDPMVAISTDKVEAEVPAPVSGVLREILAPDGTVVPVGAPIAVLDVEGFEAMSPEPNAGPPVITAPDSAISVPSDAALAHERRDQAPVVRKVARQHDLDLNTVRGSGPRGQVTLHDVEVAAATRGGAGNQGGGQYPLPAALEGDTIMRLSPVRRLVADRTSESKATIPHAWQAQEVDMAGVAASISANRLVFEAERGVRLRHLPYVVAAVAATLAEQPALNATFARDHIVLHRQVNIGIAVAVADGVLIPVLRGPDRMPVGEIAVALASLVDRARIQDLTADDLTGATFTVNNSGALGTLISYSVISPGQAGILSLGAITDRPVAVAGRVEVRPRMYLSLSLDHRVVDGMGAARFLSGCRRWLELMSPEHKLW